MLTLAIGLAAGVILTRLFPGPLAKFEASIRAKIGK